MMPMPILYLRLLVQIDLNDHLIFTMAESSLLRLYLLRFLVTAYLQFWKMQVFWTPCIYECVVRYEFFVCTVRRLCSVINPIPAAGG